MRSKLKVEVADYWRAPPGQGGRQESQSDSQGNTGDDALRGQSGGDESAKGTFVAPDPDKLVRDWTGTRQGPNEAEKFQCVGLVKKAIPEIGPTTGWQEGERIVNPGNPPLTPGTAIATFDKNGKYANISGQSHAAIFLGYGAENGRQGILVLDQFGGNEARSRFIRFGNPNGLPVNQAERFAVIKKGP